MHILHILVQPKPVFLFQLGAQLPGRPSNPHVINVGLYSATIQWTVISIRYTPETYTVRYGINRLSEESEPVESGLDFVTRYQVFSVNLTGLLPATEYTVQVVANNDYSRRRNRPQSSYRSRTFMTKENGKHVCVDVLF